MNMDVAWSLVGSASLMLGWLVAAARGEPSSRSKRPGRAYARRRPAEPEAPPSEADAQLEERLRHVQKMEALGAMGSGIAHDFNNLLAIIVASLDLAERRLDADHAAAAHIEAARKAAERAAEHTRQLLTFSRRAVLNPQLV